MKIDGILFYRPYAASTAYVLYFVDKNANQTTMHSIGNPFSRWLAWHRKPYRTLNGDLFIVCSSIHHQMDLFAQYLRGKKQ